jgi:hypothetical protein
MAKRAPKPKPKCAALSPAGRPSSLVDTRIIYCGHCLDRASEPRPLGSGPQPLPDACVDLIYIDLPFNSNRNYEVFWGETKEKRAFKPFSPFNPLNFSTPDPVPSPYQAYIEYMRPRCVELARVRKKTGRFARYFEAGVPDIPATTNLPTNDHQSHS